MPTLARRFVTSRLGAPAVWLWRRWIDWHERRLNIVTVPQEEDIADDWGPARRASGRHGDGRGYSAPDYGNLFRVAKVLDPGPEDVFYDMGSGRGRILCVMAQRPMKRVVGVELLEGLCEQARINAARMRGRRSEVEVCCGDVCKVDLSDGTIYFYYQPFGPATFAEVLERIRATLETNPRRVRLVDYRSKFEEVLDAADWLEKYDSFRTRTGAIVSFWRSKG